jgi:hypothetical protein
VTESETTWFEKMCQVLAKLRSFAISKPLKIMFRLIVVLGYSVLTRSWEQSAAILRHWSSCSSNGYVTASEVK